MTPALLQKIYHIDAHTSLVANTIATLGLAFGCIFYGVLADRFGTGPVLLVGSALLAVCTYFFYTTLRTQPELLLPLYGLTGFCVGVAGAVPCALVQAFPAQVRFSGLSFSYNLSYAIFGGLTPIIVTLMLKEDPLGPAYYVIAVCVIGMLTALFVRPAPAAA
jgi:MFS family permease